METPRKDDLEVSSSFAEGSKDKATIVNGSKCCSTSVSNESMNGTSFASHLKGTLTIANGSQSDTSVANGSERDTSVPNELKDSASSSKKNAKINRVLLEYCVPKRYDTVEFTCDVCRRKFTSKSSLASHGQFTGQDMPFSCDSCCLVFSSASHLEEHKREHTVQEARFKKVVEKSDLRKRREAMDNSITIIL